MAAVRSRTALHHGVGRRTDALIIRSRTGLAVPDLERAHLAGDHEVAVVERQRPRDPVLVELESDGVDRRLFPALPGFVEIADGHRPALEPGELGAVGSDVG